MAAVCAVWKHILETCADQKKWDFSHRREIKLHVVSFSPPNKIGIFEHNQAAWGFLSSNAGNMNEQFFVGF